MSGNGALKEVLTKFVREVDSFGSSKEERKYREYAIQFLNIRLESDALRELPVFACTAGSLPENVSKNRYRDVLPFDYNRVRLSSLTPGASDYINASYINGCFGKVAYVSTQGPLESTAEDFWRMVIQSDATTVVMLCELVEDGKPKCFKYWPTVREKKTFGGVKVSNLDEIRVSDHMTIRQLAIRHDCGKREVRQFHYHGWPDHGSPEEIEPLLDFLENVRTFQREDDCRPIVVHCSAGCGRTGTFCALDYVRSLLSKKSLPKDFSVQDLVYEFRKQRTAMVQTKDQYVLLHQCIAVLFKHRLEALLLDELRTTAAEEAAPAESKAEANRSPSPSSSPSAEKSSAAAAAAAPPEAPANIDEDELRLPSHPTKPQRSRSRSFDECQKPPSPISEDLIDLAKEVISFSDTDLIHGFTTGTPNLSAESEVEVQNALPSFAFQNPSTSSSNPSETGDKLVLPTTLPGVDKF